MIDAYDLGDLLRVTGTFTNSAGTVQDPTVVKFAFKNPAGSVTTYTYGTDAELVKSSTGIYYVDVNCSSAGTYFVRWYSTGTGQASEEDMFYVNATNVA